MADTLPGMAAVLTPELAESRALRSVLRDVAAALREVRDSNDRLGQKIDRLCGLEPEEMRERFAAPEAAMGVNGQ